MSKKECAHLSELTRQMKKNIRVLLYTFTFNKNDEGFVTLHTMK